MARDFSNNGQLPSNRAWYYRAKWAAEAHLENGGMGDVMIVDFHFRERTNYGLIDHNNYAVQPKPSFLETLGNPEKPQNLPRVFDFVADAYSIMRMNIQAAYNKGLLSRDVEAFRDLGATRAYKNPVQKYYNYMGKILDYFNKQFLPAIGLNNITSYEDYVNHFYKHIYNNASNKPVTFTRFQKSNRSSILDSGLAFEYFQIDPNEDQTKVDRIIDQPTYHYFKNLCLNMGFSIPKNTPNILVFDIASPAGKPYLDRYGIYNLDGFFRQRFDHAYLNDIYYLYNIINKYYNRFVLVNPLKEIVEIKCRKSTVSRVQRQMVDESVIPFSLEKQLSDYIKIRNIEEGSPFSTQKLNQIYKKAKYFNKKFDKRNAMRYISSMFKDQVWNKDHGYDDLLQRRQGLPSKTSGRRIKGEDPSFPGGTGY